MSEEFDSDILNLVKRQVFNAYEYMSSFEKFKERLPSKDKFHSSLTDKKLMIKSMSMLLSLALYLKWKRWKIITTCIQNVRFIVSWCVGKKQKLQLKKL